MSPTIKIKAILVSATLMIFFHQGVFAETVNIVADKDNTLYETVSGDVSNGSGQFFFAGVTDRGEKRRGIISFDLRGVVPDSAVIQSVMVMLHMSRTVVGTKTISLHKVTADWGEGSSDAGGGEGAGTAAANMDATWIHAKFANDLWMNEGGDFSGRISASTPVGGTGFYTWGSTANLVEDVQGWIDSPNSNFGWILIGPENERSAKRFDSRENGTSAFRPMLTIQYAMSDGGGSETPIPDIKANGSDGPVTISRSGALSVTVQLDAGMMSGQNADWWVVAGTPFPPPANFFHFDLISGWMPGLIVTYQGPLFDLSPFAVLNLSGLPAGTYTFYFGVDMNLNGSLDFEQLHFDSVQVTLSP